MKTPGVEVLLPYREAVPYADSANRASSHPRSSIGPEVESPQTEEFNEFS